MRRTCARVLGVMVCAGVAALLPAGLAAQPPAAPSAVPANAPQAPAKTPTPFACPPEFLKLLDQRRFDEAWDYALAECQRQPNSPYGWLLRSQVRAGQEKLDDAIREATAAVERFPSSPDVFVVRARYRLTRREWVRGLEDLDRAAALGRNDDELHICRGTAFLGLGRSIETLAEFRAVPAAGRPSALTFGCVQSLIERGELRAAEQLANESAAVLPRDGQVRFCVAVVAWAKKDHASALKTAAQAIELEPQQANLRGARATYYALLEDWQNALADETEAIRLATSSWERASYLSERASIHNSQEHWSAAVDDLTAAIDADPERAWYRIARAEALFKMRRFKEARSDFDAVIADAESPNPRLVHQTSRFGLHRRRATVNLLLGDQAAYEADRAEAERLDAEEASKEASKP